MAMGLDEELESKISRSFPINFSALQRLGVSQRCRKIDVQSFPGCAN